jgi:hypothetical protein
MQSGLHSTKEWRLEFIPESPRFIEPIMGWTGAKDMLANQVTLHFDSKEEAIKYANKYNITFKVEEPNQPLPKRSRTYVQNYSYRPYKEE